MKGDEFQCGMCGGIFTKGRPEEEAEKECVETFGTKMAHGDDRVIICDDCYQHVKPDEHPEELKRAKEKFREIEKRVEEYAKGKQNIEKYKSCFLTKQQTDERKRKNDDDDLP